MQNRWPIFAAIALGLAISLSTWVVGGRAARETSWATLEAAVPPRVSAHGFAGSSACQACHPGQHASWRETYHRSMTQLATPDTVLAPFDGELTMEGQVTRLFRQGDEFWVELDDPEWERVAFLDGRDVRQLPQQHRRRARIVMTTGSHHFQAYWIRSAYGRELWLMPWRFDLSERKWVHRRDVFLGPPQWKPGMHFKVWNDNCIFCHSVGGQPGWDPQTNYMQATSVAELGVACEACHGPGDIHVRANQNPWRRYQQHLVSDRRDGTIVNPARLDHRRASEICGSCHANFVHENSHLLITGPQFRPADHLERFGRFFAPQDEGRQEIVSRFWADGSNRSTGREFMGLKESACYQRGELSCLSCHSMHESRPDDQLAVDMEANQACVRCHSSIGADVAAHTHHPSDSAGSLCYNCHMPFTNYGLFKATRSHRITSPVVVPVEHKARPNACNLCHQDQSLGWVAGQLNAWYGIVPPELTADEQDRAAWLLWIMQGDAGLRAIAAWHARWPQARQAAGGDWQDIALVRLLDDPYRAVQWVTRRSLLSFPAWHDWSSDFYADAAVRQAAFQTARAKAARRLAGSPQLVAKLARMLQGEPTPEAIERELDRLQTLRDDRPIASVE